MFFFGGGVLGGVGPGVQDDVFADARRRSDRRRIDFNLGETGRPEVLVLSSIVEMVPPSTQAMQR